MFDLTPAEPPPSAAGNPALAAASLALRALTQAGDQFRSAVAEHFGTDQTVNLAMSHIAAGALTPQELAVRIAITPSSATSLVDRLEAAGLASRSPHPTDRRKTIVTLTTHGRETLERVRAWTFTAVSVFPAAELPAVTEMLRTLADALAEQTRQLRLPPVVLTPVRD